MKFSRQSEIKLIFLLALSLAVFISLLSFDSGDVRFLTSSPNISKENVVGFVGAYLAWGLFFLTGFGAYLIPFLIALWGVTILLEDKPRKFYLRIFGAIFSILAISSLFSIMGSADTVYRFQRGGIVGLVFSDFLLKYLGTAGTIITIALFFLLSFLITTDFLIFPFAGWLIASAKRFFRGARSVFPFKAKVKRRAAPREEIAVAPVSFFKEKATKEHMRKTMNVGQRPMVEKPKETPKTETPEKKPVIHLEPYNMPSLELLNALPPVEEREIRENLKENSKILEETLRDFGVEAKVVNVSKGPVITRYELEPAGGVNVRRITTLADNIALTMKSVSVRIVAPVPGKGTVGVEVPNAKSSLVYLREVLESKNYKAARSVLKLALGKDISGVPIISDLDDMPHLLIAGTTGSGKTVCVNSIIATLLFNASPDELKFLMFDPKRVELSVFNGLPHLLAPVITDAKKATSALSWIVEEMERRLDLFTKLGVRNIAGYKAKEQPENMERLPYIIVIIDELHDLMLVAQQEAEELIMRIAQLSRAVGIHMIIATQRPSVNVITGVIKANLPSRISFKVPSKVDSRTVLDMNGAEKLLGKGDMLFIEPGNPKPVRLQGTLVTDGEIKKLTDFVKAQRKPDFVEGIVKVEVKPKGRTFEKDEIYEEAVKVVLRTKQASVSMLQRRLGVGYTRAARLIDMMEDERIVGPYQGSKPREILLEAIEDSKE